MYWKEIPLLRYLKRVVVRQAALFAIVFFCFSFPCFGDDDEVIVHVVSLVNLIATPSAYNGKWVSIQGVVEVSSRGEPAVFLTADDATYGNLANAICLSKEGVPDDRWHSASGRWFGIRGMFDGDDRCHAGLFAGTIREIDRLEALAPSSTPARATSRQLPNHGE